MTTNGASAACSPASMAIRQAAARRDRARRRPRFPALPLRLAARGARRADARARSGRGGGRAARRLRGAGRRLGKRDPAGADRGIRAVLARRAMPRRTHLGPPAPRATADRRRGSRRHARAHDAHRPARRAATRRSGRSLSPGLDAAAARARMPRPSSASSASTAPPSSTSWWRARGLLRTQTEDALAELVALGLVNSDSFGGLRALLTPSDRRRPFAAAGGAVAP